MPKRGPSPAERQEQEKKLQQQTLAQANQVKARGGNLTTAQKQALLQEQNRQKELQRQQQAAIAAKKAADEAAAMAEAQKNPKLLQPEEPATVGPAQQDQAMRQQMYRDQPAGSRVLDKFRNMSPEERKAVLGELPIREDLGRLEGGPAKRFPVQYIKSGHIQDPVTGQYRFPTPEEIKAQQEKDAQIRQPKGIPQQTPPLMGPQQQFNSMQQQMYQTEPAEPQPEITPPVQKQEEPKIPAQQTTQAKQQEQQPVQPIKRQMVKRRM